MEINSGEMNNAIRKMIDNKDSPYFSFSDKAIPYIGWVRTTYY